MQSEIIKKIIDCYKYCGMMEVRGAQSSWVIKCLLVCVDVISWVYKLYNVTKEDNYYMCTWFTYKQRKKLSFLFVIFLFNTSMRQVIARKWQHQRGFPAQLTVKTTIVIIFLSLLSMLVKIIKRLNLTNYDVFAFYL